MGKVVSALSIALVALVLTLVVPGLIAAGGHVFYSDQMVARLPLQARQQLASFDSTQAERARDIAILDSTLAEHVHRVATSADVPVLVQLRAEAAQQLATAKPTISVIPFYLNPQMLLWPAIYTALGWLVFLFRPPTLTRRLIPPAIRVLPTGFFIYCFYEWPLWLRNFVFSSNGRSVYAYPNYDIHRPSFFTQEAVVAGFCVLLGIVWLQWSDYLADQKKSLGPTITDPVGAAVDPARLTGLADEFTRWQVCSVCLALGFAFFTSFFWSLVAGYHDQRYLVSAILAHSLWAATWILISLPLLGGWRQWNAMRVRGVESLFEQATPASAAKLQTLQETRPFSQFASGAATISALTSFLLPIINLVK